LVNYPGLTESQQQDLPELIRPASPFPAKFEDSTHQLWFCDTINGAMVLKLCNHQTIDKSTFWQGMNSLFDIDFPASLAHIEQAHHFLTEYGLLDVPEHIASQASSFVLARYLEGEDVEYESVSPEMVTQLARHIVQLHQHQMSQWGTFKHASFSAEHWPQRLQQTLILLAQSYPITIPQNILNKALEQATNINVDMFMPIMLDLRWDQMLHQQGKLAAIVDMDAYVVGPRELELVLLEYQLNAEQAACFANTYQQTAEMPDLTLHRFCYRLLLFLMNSLGETDITKWMNAPTRW